MGCGCKKAVKRVSQPVRSTQRTITRGSKLLPKTRSVNGGSRVIRRILERY